MKNPPNGAKKTLVKNLWSATNYLGFSISAEQENLLAKHFPRTLLILGSDEAGQKGIEACLESLARRLHVKAVTLPEGEQPDKTGAYFLEDKMSKRIGWVFLLVHFLEASGGVLFS